jgi:hypothetical protein
VLSGMGSRTRCVVGGAQERAERVVWQAQCRRGNRRTNVLQSSALSSRDLLPAPGASQVKAFVDLAGSLLAATATSPPGGRNGQQPMASGLSSEMLRAMKDAGVVQALTAAMMLVDLDHPKARDQQSHRVVRRGVGWWFVQASPPVRPPLPSTVVGRGKEVPSSQ